MTDKIGSTPLRMALLALLLLLSGCGITDCREGTPTATAPMRLKDSEGREYLVRHHTGCVFTVTEIPAK